MARKLFVETVTLACLLLCAILPAHAWAGECRIPEDATTTVEATLTREGSAPIRVRFSKQPDYAGLLSMGEWCVPLLDWSGHFAGGNLYLSRGNAEPVLSVRLDAAGENVVQVTQVVPGTDPKQIAVWK